MAATDDDAGGRVRYGVNCTCRAEIDEARTVTITPCCADHEAAVERAAAELALTLGIELVIEPRP